MFTHTTLSKTLRIGFKGIKYWSSGLGLWGTISPIKPPFSEETARAKVKAAQDAWNTKNPELVAQAYTSNSLWRNRTEFFNGREAIIKFLRRKWSKELDYRLMKELWCYTGNRISVRFEYEWRDADNPTQWMRTHGMSIGNLITMAL